METTTTQNQYAKETAQTIVEQLGGRKFTVMTGSKNYVFADVSETNPCFWLRMDLSRNKSSANRLKITLEWDDTYTMLFYRQTVKKDGTVIIKKVIETKQVYCDVLAEIFTMVTGLYTKFN